MKICVIDAGSVISKAAIYEDKQLIQTLKKEINFKYDLLNYGKFSDEKINTFINFIKELELSCDEIHILGAGAYRKLATSELEKFKLKLNKDCNIKFILLSSDDEIEYTSFGALKSVYMPEESIVIDTGGSSVEIAYCQQDKIIQTCNNNFGGVDVTSNFPDIKEDIATTSIQTLIEFVNAKLIYDLPYADTLILAGGDHVGTFSALYDLEGNKFTFNKDEISEMIINIYNSSLTELKKNNEGLWHIGARSRLSIVKTILERTKANKVIITSSNPSLGYIQKVK